MDDGSFLRGAFQALAGYDTLLVGLYMTTRSYKQ